MGRSLFAHLVILQVAGLAVVAWAGTDTRDTADRSPSRARLEAREAAQVDIHGFLACYLPEQNDGRACTLQLISQDTGQNLKIIGSNVAMRLYQEGKTQVVATGIISGDAIRVVSIAAAKE